MAGKKTLYHSELVQLGPVRVKVVTDVMPSKYKGKPEYVVLEVNGEERNYTVENSGCANFFRNQKGRVFTLVAEGSRDAATLTYVGESANTATSQPPPQRQQSAPPPGPPPRNNQPPPRTNVPTGNRPPPVPADQALKNARIFVAHRTSLMLICLKATMHINEQMKAIGLDIMDPEMFHSISTALFIAADRAGMANFLPQRLDMKTLEAVTAAKQQPPPQQPPPEPEPEDVPPEEEDRPF